MRSIVFIAAIAVAVTGSAEEGWDLLLGPVHVGWQTTDGPRGHTADCRSEQCDDDDWRRGNLDASIGFRVGAEREILERRGLSLLAALDTTLLLTEYNLSQHELRIVSVAGAGGVRTNVGPVGLLLRGGAGITLTDDLRVAESLFAEGAVEVPLGDLRLRAAARRARYGQAVATEGAVTLVVPPLGSAPERRWAWVVAAGVAAPGALAGDGLELKTAPLVEIGLRRRLGDGATRVGLNLDTTAWESRIRTVWIFTPGNERSQDITSVGLIADRDLGAGWLVHAGVRVADWSDVRKSFLYRDGEAVDGSRETGLVAGIARRFDTGSRPRVLVGLEQEYWTGIDLAALRLRVALEVPL